MTRMWIAILLLGLGCAAEARAGETVELGGDAPAYRLFVPSRPAGGAAPLLVMLHGCNQDAASIAAGTRWNLLAEEKGFFVLYANQPASRNPMKCWNWFLPADQKVGGREPAEIIAAIDRVETHYPIDRRRVYVAGMSAGGAMAAILMSCYPARFAAGAISSGLPYGVADNTMEAFSVMAQGSGKRAHNPSCDPHAFHGGVMVVQGLSDDVVNPANADRVLTDFLPSQATQWQTTDVPATGQSLAYHLTTVSADGRLVAERLLVEHADHAWMGGAAGMPYCDPHGPKTTEMIWSFFSGLSTAEPTAVASTH
jgi:poly(hydroxyalkanoate) depolymerase family esterase